MLKMLLGCAAGGSGYPSARARLEGEAGDDGDDLRRPHLRLPSADGHHFRFSQGFKSGALFQGMQDDPEIGIGQNGR